MPAGPHRQDLGHLDAGDAAGLAREPTLRGQEGRQRRLEARARLAVEQPVRPVGDTNHRRLEALGGGLVGAVLLETQPVEVVRTERQQVRQLADVREGRLPEELARHETPPAREVQLDVLGEPGQVGDHEDLLIVVGADERQHAVVVG